MLGARPSDLFPYFDVSRFAEFLVDGKETVPTSPTTIDANLRAVALVRSAEGRIAQAVRAKNQYTLQQLRDLVRDGQLPDGIMGQQILKLIADVVWCNTGGRKRYSVDSPQARDPACKDSQDYLDRLQRGERIFVMEGVAVYDGTTPTGEVYSDEVSQVGVLEGSRLHSNIDCARRFWGNTNRSFPHTTGGSFCDDGDRGCC